MSDQAKRYKERIRKSVEGYVRKREKRGNTQGGASHLHDRREINRVDPSACKTSHFYFGRQWEDD